MARSGPLGDREAIRIGLAQAEFAPGRDIVELVAHRCRHLADRRYGAAFGLGRAERLAGIATQAGERPHRLGPQAAILSGEADVTVIKRIAQRRLTGHPKSAYEALGGIAIEDQAMHHPHRRRSRMEVEAEREGQPPLALALMLAFDPHHRADRPGLFDHGTLDPAGVAQPPRGGLGIVVGPVLGRCGECHVAQHLAPATRRAADDRRAATADRPARVADDDLDRVAAFGDAHCGANAAGLPRLDPQVAGERRIGGHRMASPFDRAIRPPCQRPALYGLRPAACAHAVDIGQSRAARPGLAPGHALMRCGWGAVEPAGIAAGRACRPRDGIGGGDRLRAHHACRGRGRRRKQERPAAPVGHVRHPLKYRIAFHHMILFDGCGQRRFPGGPSGARCGGIFISAAARPMPSP